MTNIILSGCSGRMGEAVSKMLATHTEARIVAGVDVNTDASAKTFGFPVYQNIADFPGKADVIVDFSHHSAVCPLLDYAKAHKLPAVICTTGHTDEERKLIKDAANEIAVFTSGNMSIGINLMLELCRRAAEVLGEGFDVEIIEKHHNKKLDAPSGTAVMIADAISEKRSNTEYVYDRHNERRERDPAEIGIHSVRGGTIVGEHEVIFAGSNEVITISHTAASREIFAAGAIRAAIYMKDKNIGYYTMSDVIRGN